MNREIDFKGKCIQSGDWVHGDLIRGVGHKKGKFFILPNRVNLAGVKHCNPLDGVEVLPRSIGQFTGRHDHSTAFAPNETKGVEVYGGDIVAAHFYYMNELIQCNMEVYFNDDELQWKLRTDKYDVPMHECNYMIVKGNVYDNPLPSAPNEENTEG